MSKERIVYPFSAIVGQEKMKKALILNVINPSIGGVLIKGEKGTAKSTAVRALVSLLPIKDVVDGCRFGCVLDKNTYLCDDCSNKSNLETKKEKMKVIDLPIGATEDRVVGTLDIEYALKKGKKKFELGILANSNNNVLYVDEINLLDDHIVDVLLDSAAMGENIIEREGVSYSHPAKFVLIGTMNPEEGDLRPQLLDRFGLTVDVYGENEVTKRVEVIKRRLEFEENNEKFSMRFKNDDEKISKNIEKAKALLKEVIVKAELLELTALISIELGVDGHRADITMLKTAKTLCAYYLRKEVTREDIFESAELVLPHRMRRNPFDESGLNADVLKSFYDKKFGSN